MGKVSKSMNIGFHIAKKTNKIYIWLAVDRFSNQVVDFEGTKSRELEAYLSMASRLHRSYEIAIACSDRDHVYDQRKVAYQPCYTKSETALVESFHSLPRHYLARFHRQTKRYSQSMDMIYYSILMFFNRDLLLSILS